MAFIQSETVYYDKHGYKYELVSSDDGDFMIDDFGSAIEVKESKHGGYYSARDTRFYFTEDKPE